VIKIIFLSILRDGKDIKMILLGKNYLVLRKLESQRESLFIVVGNHYAMIIDRQRIASFKEYSGSVGGTSILVDFAIDNKYPSYREDVESFLDLTSIYGQIYSLDTSMNQPDWKIMKCTKPWMEGENLFPKNSIKLQYEEGNNKIKFLILEGCNWEILECSFSNNEIKKIFGLNKESKL